MVLIEYRLDRSPQRGRSVVRRDRDDDKRVRAVIETAGNDMRDVYGPNATAKGVLFGGAAAPQELTAFSKTIEGYAPTKK